MAAKPERRAGDENDLPQELVREILIRLPGKSILRFRSVCKSWYSLVSCPNFISDYSTRNLNKNGNRVLLEVRKNIAYGLQYSSHDESFTESCEHDDFPESFRGRKLGIVGSCNGLIRLAQFDSDPEVKTMTLLIWNPTIKKVVEVPSLTFYSQTHCLYSLGFGFDSKTSDYKVLCTSSYGVFTGGLIKDFKIFDLRKGVWRTISPPIHSWKFAVSYYSGCYLNGAVHWTNGYRDRHDGSSDRILLSFNMSDEVFREIRLPDSIGFIYDYNYCVETQNWLNILRCVTFGGLIHLLAVKYGHDDNTPCMRGNCSVWAMKEYGVTESWTNLFNIDLQNARLHPETDPGRFWIWKNNHVLSVHGQDSDTPDVEEGELLSYDNESRK